MSTGGADPLPPVIDPALQQPPLSNLLSYGPTPLLMTGLLVQLLRQHFAARGTTDEPSLRDTLWRADITGGITIEASTTWKPQATDARPAVIVKRNPWQFQKRGINNELMGGYGADQADGSPVYVNFALGSHTLNCLAPEAPQADILAAEVYRELLDFGPVFQARFGLHQWAVQGVGDPTPSPEPYNGHAVPVAIAYAFEEVWRIRQHAPVIKRIGLQVLIDGSSQGKE